MDKKRIIITSLMFFVLIAVWNGLAGIVDATNSPILSRFSTISTMAVTMPVTADANPYRVARVRQSTGNLKEGHILISNFDKNPAARGKGALIMDVAPDGTTGIFSRITEEALPGSCPGGIGQTTSLVVLRDGWVIVGVMPRTDAAKRFQEGCLVVLDSGGKTVETFSGSLITTPWDLAVYERRNETKLFVTNAFERVANETDKAANQGTVVRIDLNVPPGGVPRIASMTIVASGLANSAGPAGIVAGPTGIGLMPGCGGDEDKCPDDGERRERSLYVVDSMSNRIAVIENALYRSTSAGPGLTLSADGSLNEPRGILIAPNGHILTVNRADGVITEITPQGRQVAKASSGEFRQTAWREQAGSFGL